MKKPRSGSASPAPRQSAPKSSSRVTRTVIDSLERQARLAAKASYSPYSKFSVGAAIMAGSGKVYSGANIENASYGLCNCAERTAIFTAAAAGERVIKCVVVYTPTESVTTPCGACRQVINEFGPQAIVVSICDTDDRIETTLEALLPGAFGPQNLL